MFLLREPTFDQLKDYLWQVRDSSYTYAEVGSTRDASPPGGYTVGRQRVRLGRGRPAFFQAKQALHDWRMFPEDFVQVVWPCTVQPGRVVATLFRAPGLWTLNPCRIVYTMGDPIQKDGSYRERSGFAYGTIGDHFASGEERFSVEYDHADGTVWYEVFCFSRARHGLAKVTYPYVRMQQIRFRRLSALAMQRAVNGATEQLPSGV